MFLFVMSEVTQKTKIKFLFLNLEEFVLFCFLSSLLCPASLYYFCSMTHQENSWAYLSMFVTVFPLLTYTDDRQQHGRDEGEWRGDTDEQAQY